MIRLSINSGSERYTCGGSKAGRWLQHRFDYLPSMSFREHYNKERLMMTISSMTWVGGGATYHVSPFPFPTGNCSSGRRRTPGMVRRGSRRRQRDRTVAGIKQHACLQVGVLSTATIIPPEKKLSCTRPSQHYIPVFFAETSVSPSVPCFVRDLTWWSKGITDK